LTRTAFGTGAAGRLLCLGFVPPDLSALVRVARQAQVELGLEPIFLSVAPDQMGQDARAYVEAQGFQALDRPTSSSTGEKISNPVTRYRTLRAANQRLADELLNEIQPAAILATVNTARDLFLRTATQRGIPSVLLQLFFWSDRAYYRDWRRDDLVYLERDLTPRQRLRRKLARGVADLYGMGQRIAWDQPATRIAVQGPALRRLLVSQGMRAERVVVTGNPPLDELYQLRSQSIGQQSDVYKQLGLPAGTRFFLHCRAHEGRLYGLAAAAKEQSQREIIHALQAADSEARVVVKLHPREGEAEARFVQSLDPRVIVADETISTNALIAEGQVLVATISTTLLWAAALDRPAISAFLWPGLDYWRRAQEWAGVERVTTPAALTTSVRRYLHDAAYAEAWRQRRAAFVADELQFDGQGTDRLVKLLGQLAAAPLTSPA